MCVDFLRPLCLSLAGLYASPNAVERAYQLAHLYVTVANALWARACAILENETDGRDFLAELVEALDADAAAAAI